MIKTLTIALLLFATLVCAAEQPDLQQHPSCSFCGMNRTTFAHTRVLIDYPDGSTTATCSLRCAAVDFALSLDKSPKTISVGDSNSRQLIDAEQAFWVIGGKKPGVMTMHGKWAFAEQAAANQFIASNGGRLADFEQALEATFADMYLDTRMIRNKRKMKKMKMQHTPAEQE